MKDRNHDQIISELLLNDHIGEPDKAIEQRLMYAFMLRNNRSVMRQNSFSGFFSWLFSAQSIGMKTAFISFILFFTVVSSQFNFDQSVSNGNDTLISNRVFVCDSTMFMLSNDSILKESLQ
jgi:hypothetical protein